MLVDTPEAGVLISDERYQDALSAAATLHLDAERLTAQPQPAVEEVAERIRANAGASLGLAILGMLPPPGSATDQSPRAYLSLSDGKQVASRSYQFGNEDAMTRRWLSIRALDLVRRHLIGVGMNDECGTMNAE
jgi:nicotinamide mononucleotide (NMN) deamidase PncC